MNKKVTPNGTPYEIFVKYGGVYKSPEDRDENYLGPLVAYDGNYVGFYYYNTAPIEQSLETREYFSNLLAETIKANCDFPSCHLIATPEDFVLATDIADKLQCPVSFFEKKDRQKIQFGGNYIIFEGVCNNFFATQTMIDFIKSARGNVAAIACIINRSEKKSFCDIPVLSVIHIPTPQYRQDDPIVKKLIEECNIVWEPKKYWDFLQEEMRRGIR